MLTSFGFAVPTRVQFGSGVRAELPALLRAQGWRRIGVVLDHNLQEVGRVRRLIDDIGAAADETIVGLCAIAEPTYDSLDAARAPFMDRRLDAIVGIGGGSALDMAKAMAALATNTAPALTYRGFDKLTAPVLPIVAVPTTAGTGSEVTPNASFVDTREQRKMGINGEAVRPRFAFLDPELTLSCPRAATVSAAVDSLVHATEAYVARKTNPIARLFAREGFGRVFNALHQVLASPDDVSRRQEVMLGAFFSGVALMHSGTGPAAAMSYPLGVHYGVPHGFAGGTFLPAVAAINASAGCDAYADLYDVMDGADRTQPAAQRSRAFADRIASLMRSLGVFQDPGALKLTGDAVERFVKDTLELSGALEQNPVPFGEREIRAALASLSAEAGLARA